MNFFYSWLSCWLSLSYSKTLMSQYIFVMRRLSLSHSFCSRVIQLGMPWRRSFWTGSKVSGSIVEKYLYSASYAWMNHWWFSSDLERRRDSLFLAWMALSNCMTNIKMKIWQPRLWKLRPLWKSSSRKKIESLKILEGDRITIQFLQNGSEKAERQKFKKNYYSKSYI